MNQEGNGKSIPGGESGFVGEIPRQVWSDTGPPQGWSSPPPSYSETYPQQVVNELSEAQKMITI